MKTEDRNVTGVATLKSGSEYASNTHINMHFDLIAVRSQCYEQHLFK